MDHLMTQAELSDRARYARISRALCVRFVVAADIDGEIAAKVRREGSRLTRQLADAGVNLPSDRDGEDDQDAVPDDVWRDQVAALNADVLDGRLEFPGDTTLARNVTLLGRLIGLSPLEEDLVHLFTLLKQHRVTSQLAGLTGDLTTREAFAIVAILLGCQSEDIEGLARSDRGFLASSVIKVMSEIACLKRKIQMLGGLTATLIRPCQTPIDFLGEQFEGSAPPTLTLEDFPHQEQDARIIIRMLSGFRAVRAGPCNILLYGPPGTGKTEFARVVAREAGASLFEDRYQDDSTRLDVLRVAQKILQRSGKAVLLLDEADDLVGTPLSREAGDGVEKQQLTKVLEEPTLPVIWITNHLYRFEPALLRRFSFVVELKVPPRSVRARVFDRHLGPYSPDQRIRERWIGDPQVPPALIANAARAMELVSASATGADGAAPVVIDRVIQNVTRAMGIDRSPGTNVAIGHYRPEAINADRDLNQLVKAARTTPSGRFCLYGPPGTGKTAFAKFLADSVDRPLVIRRASDLLSRWLGGTEANIAEAFEEARSDGAVLLFDEADSFLADRGSAERSWEVTQVNELLTQLESFDGIFIAATNRLERLDSASLRRFDFKIEFRALRPDQASVLLSDLAQEIGIEISVIEVNVSGLTPGDFANVRRQACLVPPSDIKELLCRLEAERQTRDSAKGRIGFVV